MAPGHLFSGIKRKAIPGSLCRNPAALCSEWLLAHRPSVMVAAQGSPTQTSVGERERGSLAALRQERAMDSCSLNVIWLGKATCQLQLLWAMGGGGGGQETQHFKSHFKFGVKAG